MGRGVASILPQIYIISMRHRCLSWKNREVTTSVSRSPNYPGDECSVSIYTNGSKFSKSYLTDPSLGLAGHMFLPKTPQMQVAINNSPLFKINFDTQYSTVHIYLNNKHITWTYTNRIHTYE
jgi:hypothetical protein